MDRNGGQSEGGQIAEVVGRLLHDGRAYAHAELDLLKAKASKTVNAYRRTVLLGAIAAGLGFVTLTVMCISLVIALASLIGPLLGGLAATLLVAAATAVFAMLAKKSFEDANER